MSDTDRATELEIALAHQGRVVEELSGVVAEQAGRIDRLEKTLRALAERFLALEEAAAPRAEITPPPHY